MSDPADKTDDLIAELAKLMAAAPGGAKPAVTPVPKPAPLSTAPTATPQQPSAPAATPVRIPGMDPIPPKPAAPAATPQAEAPRAPATGTIRIPGMDQPAPVSTSAPVSKFDFGKPVSAAAPIRQEPLSTLSERLAAHDPVPPQPAPSVRIPSSLTPVSENRSFAEGPALSVAKPEPAPAAPSSGSDFHFDFGFAQNPPASSSPPRAVPPQPQPGPPPLVNRPAAEDPIAALIEADMDQGEPEGADDAVEAEQHDVRAPEPAHPQVTPIRPVAAAPAKPSTPPVSPGSARPAASTPIPLKPVSVAPRAPESDRFAISPGVGLNMKPQPGQPLAAPQQRAPEPKPEVDESDPMSEIESLIGEAVRVELTPGPVRVQAPQSVAPQVSLESEDEVEEEIADAAEPPPPAAPVVPPLTTQFAPRRANLKDDAAARSAEDAILAAAAASGAEVGRVEPSIGDESPYRRLKVKPQRSGFFSGGVRQYVGMAVAGTLLLAAGLGLYWVLNMGRLGGGNTGAAAPQLTADATPVKEVPTAPAKPATDAAKSPVLAKMDNATPAPSSEQLVSTDQATAAVTRDVTPVADDNDNGLANRKVRTVTVRPDGTIVSGDDAVAGGEELPVERPNVPSVPSSESTNLLGSDTVASASAPTLAPTTTTPLAPGALTDSTDSTDVADIAPVIDPNAVAPVPMQFPVRSAASAQPRSSTPTNTSVNALVGAQTPNGQIDLLGGGTPATNATQRVATATPARSTPAANDGGNAAAYVQLSSQPSEADAQASIRSVTAKYGSLFGGSKLVIQQVDLGQKGVRWRVRLPTSSLTDATSICAQIKAQGGDCFATNG